MREKVKVKVEGSSRRSHIGRSLLGVGGALIGLNLNTKDKEHKANAVNNFLNGSTEFKKTSMVDSLSIILASKKILVPVERYIEIGQYDPGRTNVNYCTKILRVRKALENVVSTASDNPAVDLEKLDTAVELTASADNSFSQLDSSIYTLIFIPNDSGELPRESKKYLVMAQDYYKTVMDSIDAAIALGTPEELAEARKIADKMEFPPFLFKKFSGDFYRAATP